MYLIFIEGMTSEICLRIIALTNTFVWLDVRLNFLFLKLILRLKRFQPFQTGPV